MKESPLASRLTFEPQGNGTPHEPPRVDTAALRDPGALDAKAVIAEHQETLAKLAQTNASVAVSMKSLRQTARQSREALSTTRDSLRNTGPLLERAEQWRRTWTDVDLGHPDPCQDEDEAA